MLNEYLQMTQRFLRDQKMEMLAPETLITYINRSRREVAMRAQCMRQVTPISGSIQSWVVTNGGSGYVSPTLLISPPDFSEGIQAAGTVTVTNGVVTGINNTSGGTGYWQPTGTLVDSSGAGATVTPVMTFFGQVTTGREVYPFSAVNLAIFPGYDSVYMIKSVSIIYSNYRYSLACYSFTDYQALFRNYVNYAYIPTVCAQVGRGTAGSFYFYPVPSQPYQIEWDCFCLPQDLIDDLSVEAIPHPFTDAVPFLAAYYAYMELQNLNHAEYYKKQFDEWMQRYGAYTNPGRLTNPYGRSY